MPRHAYPWRWDSTLGAGLAVVKRQAAAGDFAPAVVNTAAPGFREHPPRPGLDRVERDNPVGVRTLVRSADREGGPTPRRAQDSPRSECRCAERRRESGTAGRILR